MLEEGKRLILESSDLKSLEVARVEIFAKKSPLSQALLSLKDLPPDERKIEAARLNSIKNELSKLFENRKQELANDALLKSLESEKIDPSLYSNSPVNFIGHPINYTKSKIIDYFISKGYDLRSGPLIEDDFHNFTALNIPAYHPARDMQDTFYFEDSKLLRTHTSCVQIRGMLSTKPPLKFISPGAVFRRDYDMTHTPMFHQIEGLVVDEIGKCSFANLKHTISEFLTYIFGDVKLRFRSSFFPFTEPSAEVDIGCIFCKNGCRVCGHTGYIEVLGCGMVNDKVFESVGYSGVSGYAFGVGIERIAMLTCNVNDLRSFFEMDLRAMGQF